MTLNKTFARVSFASVFGLLIILLLMVLGSSKADAKTITIKTPTQLKNINWKNEGFGPGNTYKIGNDMTLGDKDDSTCLLTKGKFVIDLNGHTVQNNTDNLTVFRVSGADVTIKDSKVKKNKPSVRSYGAGAVQITSGKLTIKSGNYLGASDGNNNPSGLYVGGGTCVVKGGTFAGDFVGAACAGGKLKINGGKFISSYMFALLDMGGNVKITKGSFSNTKTNGFNPTFALGALNTSGSNYNFGKWLAKGSSFSPTVYSYYWNGTSNDTSPYPTKMVGTQYVQTPYTYPYAVAYTGNSGYEAVTIKVKTKATPATPVIKSISAGSRALSVKWNKNKKTVSGYQIQYSSGSKFKSYKLVTVKGAKTSRKLSKLTSGRKYYVRVRAYRSINGTKLCSKWSKTKSKAAK